MTTNIILATLPEWEGTFAQHYSNGHRDSTTINCNGSMVWHSRDTMFLKRFKGVNDEGQPHPDSRYRGWYYRPWSRAKAYEYFRFTENGELQVHHFCLDGCSKTSPLGSPNFCCSSLSSGGQRCNKIN